MKDCDIILASGAEHLQDRFESHGFRVFTSELNYDNRRLFPNADIYVRIRQVEELSNRRVIVVQSCTGAGPAELEPYTTSDRVIELLLILDILRNPTVVTKVGHKKYSSKAVEPASRVEVILTFQPYALQDKAFKTGEAVSGKWATEQISMKCDKIWVVNPHAHDNLEWVKELTQEGKYEEIDIIPDLIKYGRNVFSP